MSWTLHWFIDICLIKSHDAVINMYLYMKFRRNCLLLPFCLISRHFLFHFSTSEFSHFHLLLNWTILDYSDNSFCSDKNIVMPFLIPVLPKLSKTFHLKLQGQMDFMFAVLSDLKNGCHGYIVFLICSD